MTDITTLSELKTQFLSDQNTISSREMFSYLESILYGTTHVRDYLNANDTSDISDNQSLFVKVRDQGTVSERYPSLASKITKLDYSNGDTMQEWDLGLYNPKSKEIALFVWLNNNWCARCSVGDNITKENADHFVRGLRLESV